MSERSRDLPRRSCLSIPGSSEKMVGKGPGIPADMVFLDLEDACAPAEKPSARALAAELLTTLDFGGKLRVLETVTTVRVVESVRTLPYIGNLPAEDDPEADPTPPHGTPRPTTDRRLAP